MTLWVTLMFDFEHQKNKNKQSESVYQKVFTMKKNTTKLTVAQTPTWIQFKSNVFWDSWKTTNTFFRFFFYFKWVSKICDDTTDESFQQDWKETKTE